MFADILYLLAGLALIVLGGNWVTDGSVAIAKRMNVSSLIIGMTVVAFGSSTPDLAVCLFSTCEGKTQMTLGDIVGANIFDMLMVVGVMALIRPVNLSRQMLSTDLPALFIASLMLFICADCRLFDHASTNTMFRSDGLVFLIIFAIFMYVTLKGVRTSSLQNPVPVPSPGRKVKRTGSPHHQMPIWLAILAVVGGLGILVLGGNWIVDGASGIALKAGMSESLVGLTIVAVGSSVPDLATSVTAAIKRQPGIALGNIVGACIFNIYFIVGLCATIRPLAASEITTADLATLAGAALAIWLLSLGRAHTIGRVKGAFLTLAYIAYLAYLVTNAAIN